MQCNVLSKHCWIYCKQASGFPLLPSSSFPLSPPPHFQQVLPVLCCTTYGKGRDALAASAAAAVVASPPPLYSAGQITDGLLMLPGFYTSCGGEREKLSKKFEMALPPRASKGAVDETKKMLWLVQVHVFIMPHGSVVFVLDYLLISEFARIHIHNADTVAHCTISETSDSLQQLYCTQKWKGGRDPAASFLRLNYQELGDLVGELIGFQIWASSIGRRASTQEVRGSGSRRLFLPAFVVCRQSRRK